MQVITAVDNTVRIELTAYAAKVISDDRVNGTVSAITLEFTQLVDHLFGKQSAPTFPGGGF